MPKATLVAPPCSLVRLHSEYFMVQSARSPAATYSVLPSDTHRIMSYRKEVSYTEVMTRYGLSTQKHVLDRTPHLPVMLG